MLLRLFKASYRLKPDQAALVGIHWSRWQSGRKFAWAQIGSDAVLDGEPKPSEEAVTPEIPQVLSL